jgi:hypothetical protein
MTAGPNISKRASRLILLGLWLATCAALIATTWHFIVPLNFRDPDDALRLVQVRDLLAGQSWFDLTQHRIYPPEGVPMHWSRLVDAPVALLLWLLNPLLGQALAERIVLVAVPLGALLILALLLYRINRTLAFSRAASLLALAMLFSTLSILIQFAPLRIDHHAMQMIAGAAAMLAVVSAPRSDGRRGLIAGVAMACWLQISFEGLPYAVAIGGILAASYVFRAERWADFQDYMLALPLVSAALLVGTRYPADAMIPWCDSFSPAYLSPLGLVSLLLLVGQKLCPGRTPLLRAIPLAIAGGAGAALFIALSRECLAGPFETLDPIVYQLWYLAVREGLPLTAQKLDLQAIIIAPAILGFIGTAVAIRRADEPRVREAWIVLLAMQVMAFLVALSVMRAMGFAHLMSLPGNTMLVVMLVAAAQRMKVATARVLGTSACLLATPIGASWITAGLINQEPANAAGSAVPDRYRCTTAGTLRGLDTLPSTLIYTPLDIGAHLLVYTHHSVVATGHHRNAGGMKTVLTGLTAPAAEARAIVTESGARYLAFCRGENEVARYTRLYPRSLMADLAAGRTPVWLEPVAMRPGESIRVYRIARPTD